MASGIFQHLVDATCIQVAGVGIAEAGYHAIWEEILGRVFHRIHQDRTLLEEVDASLLIQHIGKLAQQTEHRSTIARRLIPSLAPGIETEVDEFVDAPLSDAILIDDIIQVVLLALAIGIGLVILQYQGYLDDEVSLKQVPVVVRHTIGDDVLRPLLEACLNDRLVILHEILDERIHLGQFIDGILMDYLEGRHAHQGLLMSVVEVERHVAVGDAFHIDIEYLSCHLAIAQIASGGIDASGITGETDNLTIDTGNITTSLGWGSLLHLARHLINIGHIALLIVIVG